METASAILGVTDLKESGTPVEIIEADEDNTTISRLRSEHGVCVKTMLSRTLANSNIVYSMIKLSKSTKQ